MALRIIATVAAAAVLALPASALGADGGSSSEASPSFSTTELTYCLTSNGDGTLTSSCTSAVADLKALFSIAVGTPDSFTSSDSAILGKLCEQPPGADSPLGCVQQLLSLGITYASEMSPPAVNNTCTEVLGMDNAISLGIWATYFTCLPNPSTGAYCMPAVAKALYTSKLSPLLAGDLLENYPSATDALCSALSAAGCCGGSFVQLLAVYYATTCNTASLELLTNMVESCAAPGVPDSCEGYNSANLPPYTPPDCTAGVAVSAPPASCGLGDGACPATPCQLLCSIAHL